MDLVTIYVYVLFSIILFCKVLSS